jgi:hypothetical protein
MATVKSLQMTEPRYPVSGPGMGGRSLKIERASYTGAGAIGDVIQLFKLHPRFRVIGGYVKNAANTASATLNIGDADDVDRYFAATAITTAAVTNMTVATGIDYLNPKYNVVNATIAGAALNGTGEIVVVIWGTVEEPA